jgi:hypothetical protein
MGKQLTSEQIEARINAYDVPSMVENIAYYLDRADHDTVQAGLAWYGQAAQWCLEQSLLSGVDYLTVVTVTACLSQRNEWTNNKLATIMLLRAYVDGHKVCPKVHSMIGEVTDRAWQILTAQQALSGRKVTRFRANILGDGYPATVDAWAIRAASKWAYSSVENDWHYLAAERAYQQVAASRNMRTCDAQAIAWIEVMRDAQAKSIVKSAQTRGQRSADMLLDAIVAWQQSKAKQS